MIKLREGVTPIAMGTYIANSGSKFFRELVLIDTENENTVQTSGFRSHLIPETTKHIKNATFFLICFYNSLLAVIIKCTF